LLDDFFVSTRLLITLLV